MSVSMSLSATTTTTTPTKPGPNRPSVTVMPVVRHAEDLVLSEHVHLPPMYVNKAKGFRLVKVQSSKSNPHPLRIQFSNSSGENTRIPAKFGVDTNAHGKTYLTFPVSCEKEYGRMVQFQEDIKQVGKELKTDWWPYAVTDSQVEDNFANFVSNKKEKSEGPGFWPGNMKVGIPMGDDGECVDCIVVGPDGENMSIHDVLGMSWDTVVVEVSGIYFQNRYNWGLGPKTLRFLRISPGDEVVDISPKNIDFATIALRKKSENVEIPSVDENAKLTPQTIMMDSSPQPEHDSGCGQSPQPPPTLEATSTKRHKTEEETPRKRRKKDESYSQ